MNYYLLVIALFGFGGPDAAAPDYAQAEPAKATTKHIDVSYVEEDSPLQKLDIYLPKSIEEIEDESYPVHIFVHGGGWNIGDKKSVDAREAKVYTSEDIIVVSINYRLSPTHKHPAHVQDCAEAIKWVIDNIAEYGGDAENITLSGHSSGAHLVTLLGTHPRYLAEQELSRDIFKGIVAIDTAGFDLTIPAEQRAVQRWTRNAFGTSLVTLQEASPMAYVSEDASLSPILIYTTAERPNAVEQSRRYTSSLLANGHNATLSILDRGLSHSDMKHLIFTKGTEIHGAITSLSR